MLITVAGVLEGLPQPVVYTGGATIPLYKKYAENRVLSSGG
jgi:hypothetical protein